VPADAAPKLCRCIRAVPVAIGAVMMRFVERNESRERAAIVRRGA